MNAMSDKMTMDEPKKKRQVLSPREEDRKGMGGGAGIKIRTSISQACVNKEKTKKQQQQPVCRRQKKKSIPDHLNWPIYSPTPTRRAQIGNASTCVNEEEKKNNKEIDDVKKSRKSS